MPRKVLLRPVVFPLQKGHKDVKDFLAKKAGVGLNAGGQFGAKYTAYVRINAATQKANIVEAMNRIKAALDNQ